MATTNEKKYEIKLDKIEKVLFAKVFGFFRPADANGFIEEYNANIKDVNTKEYQLLFDCKGLKVSGKDIETGTDMANMLKACLEMYKNDGFKKTVFDCEKNFTLKMQLSRLVKEVELPNFEITI